MNTATLFLVLIAELLILYILSIQVTNLLYRRLHRITNRKKFLVYIFSAVLFPGTVLHELSHLIVATILLVPTGRIALLPCIEEQGIQLGSVQIARVDPFRKLLIGIAPLFVGVVVILSWLWIGTHYQFYSEIWYLLLSAFLMFEIGNTMFLSKADLQGTSMVFVLLIAVFIGMRILGIEISFPSSILVTLQFVLEKASVLLFIPILLDLALVLFLKLL